MFRNVIVMTPKYLQIVHPNYTYAQARGKSWLTVTKNKRVQIFGDETRSFRPWTGRDGYCPHGSTPQAVWPNTRDEILDCWFGELCARHGITDKERMLEMDPDLFLQGWDSDVELDGFNDLHPAYQASTRTPKTKETASKARSSINDQNKKKRSRFATSSKSQAAVCNAAGNAFCLPDAACIIWATILACNGDYFESDLDNSALSLSKAQSAAKSLVVDEKSTQTFHELHADEEDVEEEEEQEEEEDGAEEEDEGFGADGQDVKRKNIWSVFDKTI